MNLKNPALLRIYKRAAIYHDVLLEKQSAIYDAMHVVTPAARRRVINKLNAIYYWEKCHA